MKSERKKLSDGREVEILTFSGGAIEIHEIKANGERVDLVESGEFDTLEEGLDFVEENAQAGKATKFAEAKEHLDGLLKESKLPDAAKERLRKQFNDSEGTDGMEKAIEEEGKYLAKVAAGKVRDLDEARFEERMKRFQRSGLTPEEAEVAAIGHGADPRKHDRKRSFQKMGLTEAEAELAASDRR
jgi:DNA-binding CsgD family transcriptional regulator